MRNVRSILHLLLITVFVSCLNKPKINQSKEETQKMVHELDSIYQNGDPLVHYHWNKRRAEYFQAKIKQGSPQEQINHWFEFCKESLYAGESQLCIDELNGYLQLSNIPLREKLNASTKSMFELLALAYLRLGEQENCLNNHTAQACILPLGVEGVHQIKYGSEKAVELYTMLLEKFPNEKYRWLLYLASMTLGNSPNKTSGQHLIPFPNWELEQKDFPLFEQVSMEKGVAVNGLSGGVCSDDFNSDGLLDLFVTSYGMQDQSRLFLNDGKGAFTETTDSAGLQGIVSGLNCIHADYDNDGNKDLLILRGGWLEKGGKQPNSLLKNLGDGTFSDVSRSAGILSYHPSQTAAWGDFNRDGNLDLFIGNESKGQDQHPCELYLNNGDGTFKEVASQYGLDIKAYVKAAVWGDINNDMWPDLYISVLGGKNLLFKNEGGRFTEIAEQAGVEEPIFSFPTWFFDVNNDGFQDLFVSSYDVRYFENLAADYVKELKGLPQKGEKLKLYVNNGDETFKEVSREYGIDKAIYSMGCNFGDLDNDGYLDFYLGTGAPDLSTVVPNRMFRNVNGSHFEEVTSAGNFGHIQKGHGVAFADLDNDGDQDIYMVLGGAYEGDVFSNILYENPISDNNWITIELEGNETNRSAIGSRIELELENGRKLYRSVGTGGSFGSSSLQQEIGLGQAKKISRLKIYWQNGDLQEFSNVKTNQYIKIIEGQEYQSSIVN